MKSAVLIALLAAPAAAQYTIPQPTYNYAGGVLGSYDYGVGQVTVPTGKQYQFDRKEFVLTVGTNAQSYASTSFHSVYGASASSWAYGHVVSMTNYGPGLANGDYVRVQGGTGANIAHKTAVRGAAAQWAVWGEQMNLGPGAKAGYWIGSDNAVAEGRGFDTVPNVIVIADDLHVSGAAIQRNAPAGGNGAVLRVFQGSSLVAELMEDGTLRVKRIEILP